ncbi:MAG: hypothetical protein JXR40_11850 [Pontiellaceae bacterium]|nr:hypothetical protein [Pontiellaceae bacterium]
MEAMTNILLSAISAIIASYITYYFVIRSKKEEAKLKSKEEKYLKLLLLLKGFVGKTANSQTKKAFFDEYYQAWLYSSDEVIESINLMIESVKNTKLTNNILEGRKLVGNIVKAMRKDLYGKTKLNSEIFEYIDVIE